MNKKIIIIVSALALIVFMQAGYILGSKNSEKKSSARESEVKQVQPLFANQNQSNNLPSASPRQLNLNSTPMPNPFSSRGAWDPFEEMHQMQKMMNQMFNSSFSRTGSFGNRGHIFSNAMYEPSLESKDTGDAYVYELEIPGIDKDKISIQVEDQMLRISGVREVQQEREDDSGYYQMQSSTSSFMRTLALPPDASSEGMEARVEGDALVIRIHKIQDVGSKANATIPIQ